MSNPFKSLDPEKKLPDSVKDQTMGNLYAAKMIMDIIDLFVAKAGTSAHLLISPGFQETKVLPENKIENQLVEKSRDNPDIS
ncbi:MAG: hypothetical protein SF052_04840 [Bacteroidia bacterium]|nr:hypothetical protein [Bacteroidia bacterium]